MKNGIKNYSDLARHCGVKPQQVSQVMSGKTNASYVLAVKVYKAIGGGVLLWMDPKRVDERKDVFDRYKEKPME